MGDRRQINKSSAERNSRKTLQPAAQGQNQPRPPSGKSSAILPNHPCVRDTMGHKTGARHLILLTPRPRTRQMSRERQGVFDVRSDFSSFSRRCLGDSFFRRVPYRQLNQVGRRRQIECGIGCSNSWRRDAVTGAEQSTSSGRRVQSNGRASSRQRKGYL